MVANDIFIIRIFSEHKRLIVYDKDLIKQIMVKESGKYTRPQFGLEEFMPGLSNTLGGSPSGKEHARQKKLIHPAFHLTHLKTFLATFVESSEELVQVSF